MSEDNSEKVGCGSGEWLALRDSVEQGRRNVEALTRLLPHLGQGAEGILEGEKGEIRKSLSLNIKVMNKVIEL